MEKQSTRKFLKLIVALVALFLLGASALMLASCNKDEHQHSYTSSVTTPATCSNPGVETFTCSCGLTYTQIIPATGDHSWEKVKEYPASCESEGWTVYECSVCHEQKQDDWVQKRDHKYEAVETVEATCTTDGYQIMQCSYCGDRYTDDQYSSEHKATGHKWIANTDAEDPASAEDKKLGFVTVKEADCLNAAQLERKCSVCGHTEPKESGKPLGHAIKGTDGTLTVPTTNLCKIDTTLVDAEGNAVYAFECDRENCPVEVKIDKAGNTAHYVKAAEHKMKTIEEVTYCVDEDSDDKVPTLDDGTSMGKGEGHRYEICENCDTYGKTLADNKYKETVLEPTGHKWNTVQFDEDKSPVVVCEIDEHLTKEAYLNAMKATMGNIAYGPYSVTFSTYYGNEGAKYSRYCADCGALQVAEGHDYVVSPLEEGKYDLEDYQKNEDGSPVVAEGVTAATMDCRYVQVCQNEGCGKVLERGQHDPAKTVAATCRAGGHCEVCGEEFSAQLNHTYKSVEDIIKYKDSAKPDEKALYNAYVKVSATETWMTPLDGGCDEKSTTVYVCTKCLTDALDEKNEVVWNQATEVTKPVSEKDPTPAPAAVKTNAYVITNDFGHDYVPVYYTLDGQEKVFSQITCAVGFNVKYVCDKCGFVFTNVPVANDPNTAPEEGKEQDTSETNEARNNKTANVDYTDAYGNKKSVSVYTDADGFVLDVDGADLEVAITSVNFQADELAAVLASKVDNKGDHDVTVADEYAKRNGYAPSTCVSTAVIPVVCANCGANLSYTYEQLKTESNTDGFKYVWAEDTENSIDSLEDAVNAVVKNESDRKLNYLNHAEGAKIFDCGTHCDASTMVNGVKTYICSGYVDGHATTANITAASSNFANMFNEDFHSTVTVSYKLAEKSNYYSDYTIRVATIAAGVTDADDIDWTEVTFTTDTKLSVCASNSFASLTSNTKYTMPKASEKLSEGGTFFVLTDSEGTNYLVNTFKLYTEDKGDASMTPVQNNQKVAQDDTFFLDVSSSKAPVHATDEASLEKAIMNAEPDANGALTVQFAAGKAITLEDTSVWTTVDHKVNGNSKIKSLVFDFNGGSVSTGTAIPFDAWKYCKAITFKNGTFTFTNTTGTAITVNSASALTLTFEDVDIVTTSDAISVKYASTVANQSKLILKDSTVTSYGEVGISVDAPKATPSAYAVAATAKPVVTLTNTTVNMTKAPTAPANSQGELAAALVVGAPVYVDVNGGSLIANGQPLVVRGGKVEVSTTSITLNAYNDTRVVVKENADSSKNQVTWASLFSGQTTAVSTTWQTFVEGVSTVQEYRMAGLWGTGAAVARAAIVVGNSDKANYDFYANVRLDRVSINVGENEQTIVIGTEYESKTNFYSTTTGEGTAATTTQNAVVTINATGSALSSAAIAYTNNCYTGTTLTHAANVSLVGFIAD